MKKMIGMLAVLGVAAGLALAGSPAHVMSAVATNGTAITVPASGSTAFKLQAVVFSSSGVNTASVHTVALVHGSITNQIGTKLAVNTADLMLWVTNAPWQFQGDKVRITTTSTNALSADVIGETGE